MTPGPRSWRRWWYTVRRADFAPSDGVLIAHGAGTITAGDLDNDGPVLRTLHWFGLLLWLLFALPFGVGLVLFALPLAGVPVVADESFRYTSWSDPLWRIPLALFSVAMGLVSLGQWVTAIAYLRFRVRRRSRGRGPRI